MLLHRIKHTLNGAIFEVRCAVKSNNDSDFNDDSTLLKHIGNEILPITNACRSYTFTIKLLSYPSATNVSAKILQFGPIDGCSNVFFNLYQGRSTELPINIIADWLNFNRNYNANTVDKNGIATQERFLEIAIIGSISNLSEMVNDLKKVTYTY